MGLPDLPGDGIASVEAGVGSAVAVGLGVGVGCGFGVGVGRGFTVFAVVLCGGRDGDLRACALAFALPFGVALAAALRSALAACLMADLPCSASACLPGCVPLRPRLWPLPRVLANSLPRSVCPRLRLEPGLVRSLVAWSDAGVAAA